jgi:hypothetical protein
MAAFAKSLLEAHGICDSDRMVSRGSRTMWMAGVGKIGVHPGERARVDRHLVAEPHAPVPGRMDAHHDPEGVAHLLADERHRGQLRQDVRRVNP